MDWDTSVSSTKFLFFIGETNIFIISQTTDTEVMAVDMAALEVIQAMEVLEAIQDMEVLEAIQAMEALEVIQAMGALEVIQDMDMEELGAILDMEAMEVFSKNKLKS